MSPNQSPQASCKTSLVDQDPYPSPPFFPHYLAADGLWLAGDADTTVEELNRVLRPRHTPDTESLQSVRSGILREPPASVAHAPYNPASAIWDAESRADGEPSADPKHDQDAHDIETWRYVAYAPAISDSRCERPLYRGSDPITLPTFPANPNVAEHARFLQQFYGGDVPATYLQGAANGNMSPSWLPDAVEAHPLARPNDPAGFHLRVGGSGGSSLPATAGTSSDAAAAAPGPPPPSSSSRRGLGRRMLDLVSPKPKRLRQQYRQHGMVHVGAPQDAQPLSSPIPRVAYYHNPYHGNLQTRSKRDYKIRVLKDEASWMSLKARLRGGSKQPGPLTTCQMDTVPTPGPENLSPGFWMVLWSAMRGKKPANEPTRPMLRSTPFTPFKRRSQG